jgi:hypothetical protein
MADATPETNGWFRSRSLLVLIAFLAIAAFFVVTEHTAHVLGILPYLLLLACPLIHLFHGGHRHGGHDEHTPPRADGDRR